VGEATLPVSHSSPAFTVPEGDSIPESMAYDPKGKTFYLGEDLLPWGAGQATARLTNRAARSVF
jgi:hypothetical protein